jgi:hypothetical protein
LRQRKARKDLARKNAPSNAKVKLAPERMPLEKGEPRGIALAAAALARLRAVAQFTEIRTSFFEPLQKTAPRRTKTTAAARTTCTHANGAPENPGMQKNAAISGGG